MSAGQLASSAASCRACPSPCLLLLLAVAAVAGAQGSPTRKIAHDGSLDGTPREIHSGLYAGDPPSRRPARRARRGHLRDLRGAVPEGTRHSRLEAGIGWKDKRIDLDLYVYRRERRRPPVAPAVARSAAKGVATERAVYAPPGATVEPGRYLVVVDNVCSRDADDDPRSPIRPSGPTAGSARRSRTRTTSRAP